MEIEEWVDLSDSELQAKLEQRGVNPDVAAGLVKLRDQPEFIEDLAEFIHRL